MKIVKYICVIFSFIVIFLMIYTTAYYWTEIRPYADSLEDNIAQYQSLPSLDVIESMAVKEYGRNGIARYAAHSLAVENIDNGFRSFWHVIGLHWHLWVNLIYNEQEQYSLWLSLIPYGSGRGMYEASMHHFNKPIEQLSCYQLAQLVVMVRSPKIFKPYSERSEKRIRERGVADACA